LIQVIRATCSSPPPAMSFRPRCLKATTEARPGSRSPSCVKQRFRGGRSASLPDTHPRCSSIRTGPVGCF
jgi:hypothetical protein